MSRFFRFAFNLAVFSGFMGLLGHSHLDVYALPTQPQKIPAVIASLKKKWKRISFRPEWLPQYQVRSHGLGQNSFNTSYLAATDFEFQHDPSFLQSEILDMDPGKTAEWRGQFENRMKEEDARSRAGLYSLEQRRAVISGMNGTGVGMLQEMQKYKLAKASSRATRLATRLAKDHREIQPVVAPVVIAAGIYIGRPIHIRLSDESRLSVRTDFRFKTGGMELATPYGLGTFEFRPLAPESRLNYSSSSVNFAEAMQFDRAIDFSQERYQFSIARGLPVWGLSSTVLYGSSSNALVGSLSKQLTPSLSFVVDSIHYLSSFDPSRSTEEKVRLKYDIHF